MNAIQDSDIRVVAPAPLPPSGALAYAERTCAVIVGYRPNQHQLQQLCASLTADGSHVVIVDNTETPYLDAAVFPVKCRVISLGSNTGIAHAQNVGIETAIADGAGIIAFFDQDSTIASGFLRTLISPLRVGSPDVVSPLCVDDVSDAELPSVRISKYGTSAAIFRGNISEPYDVDVVISSGIAATREVFQVAGLLDEGLFIDFVDTEWCLRCRSKGIPIRVVPAAVMRHRIGTKSVRVARFTVLVHTPERCYYQLRNCFHLFRKSHIPVLFALRQTSSVFFSRVLLLFVLGLRSDYLKAYLKAVRDGLTGVDGAKAS